jgi:hypothetical protein
MKFELKIIRHSLLIDDITVNIIIVKTDLTSTDPAIATTVLATILVATDTTIITVRILEIHASFARNQTAAYKGIPKRNKTLKRPDSS